MGVSELVTNALLHGGTPIMVRMRGTEKHPRVEVHDASTQRPVLPSEAPDGVDDLLLTFGRGLSIVARGAEAWGAEIEGDGKVVWFTPAADFAEGQGVEGVVTAQPGAALRTRPPAQDPVDVVVLGLPVQAYVGFQHHFRELRREVRLLAFAHETDYPLASHLSNLFGTLERQLHDGIGTEQMQSAVAAGAPTVDVRLRIPRATTVTLQRFADLLDLADDFCREQRLLSLARTVEQRRFQRWFLDEFVRQGNGEAPTPWPALDVDLRRSSVS